MFGTGDRSILKTCTNRVTPIIVLKNLSLQCILTSHHLFLLRYRVSLLVLLVYYTTDVCDDHVVIA